MRPLQVPRIVQVEVTSACQLRCTFCARTALADRWITAHLPWEAFSALLPHAGRIQLVHLQGWGEPLLHPRLWDMAAALKQAGCKVSLTTNAMLLDEEAAREACRVGLDLVAVSLAGARATTNDALRVGSSLERIAANVSFLCGQKPRPRVVLIMQMMPPNLPELPELVSLARELGADEVSAPNLDYIPSRELDSLRAFGREPDPAVSELTVEAKRRGEELGVAVRIFGLTLRDDVMVCEADPLHNLWIAVDGRAGPCGYLALPSREGIPRLFQGTSEHVPRLTFGDVIRGLPAMWQSRTARSFRQAFARRQRWGQVEFALDALLNPSAAGTPPPAPPPCRHCYKLYGI
ncbi:MAG: radical SAM/SPASM domain-containing protein [Bacillota bacterium]